MKKYSGLADPAQRAAAEEKAKKDVKIARMLNVYPTAKFWFVPQDIAAGSCAAPGWSFLDSDTIFNAVKPVTPPEIW